MTAAQPITFIIQMICFKLSSPQTAQYSVQFNIKTLHTSSRSIVEALTVSYKCKFDVLNEATDKNVLLRSQVNLAYHQGPVDKRQMPLDVEEEEDEEDDVEDPESDGHKHHPAISGGVHVGGAGYERPVDHPQELQGEQTTGQ